MIASKSISRPKFPEDPRPTSSPPDSESTNSADWVPEEDRQEVARTLTEASRRLGEELAASSQQGGEGTRGDGEGGEGGAGPSEEASVPAAEAPAAEPLLPFRGTGLLTARDDLGTPQGMRGNYLEISPMSSPRSSRRSARVAPHKDEEALPREDGGHRERYLRKARMLESSMVVTVPEDKAPGEKRMLTRTLASYFLLPASAVPATFYLLLHACYFPPPTSRLSATGDQTLAVTPAGTMSVTIPEGLKAGDMFSIKVPRQPRPLPIEVFAPGWIKTEVIHYRVRKGQWIHGEVSCTAGLKPVDEPHSLRSLLLASHMPRASARSALTSPAA